MELYIAPGQSFLMILEKADCEVCDQGLEKQKTENLDPKRKDLNAKTEKSCPETNQEKSKMETDYGEPGPEADLPPIHRFYSPLDQQKVVSVTDLSREWELTVPTLDFQTQLSVLEGFEKIPRLRYYSGEVIYRKEVWLAQEEMGKGRILLQAEEVGCCARVRVNGRAVADWIMRPYLADITEAARPGTNTLEIAVSNLLINRFLDPDRKIYEYPDRLMDEWPYFPQQLIKERGKRLDAWRERELVKEPVCSGLTGAMNILIWMPCNEI